jgi:hypothetical protein
MIDDETKLKIIKLLELSRNNPNENEAKFAKEKADKVMKDNNITFADLFIQPVTGNNYGNPNPSPATYGTNGGNPSTEDFRVELRKKLADAEKQGMTKLIVKSGDLHKEMRANARMPMCCNAMRSVMKSSDIIIESPPLGNGSRLIIEYRLPR